MRDLLAFRRRGVGVDCVGLVVEIYRELGVLAELAWPPYVVGGGSHLRVSTLAATVAATGRFVRVGLVDETSVDADPQARCAPEARFTRDSAPSEPTESPRPKYLLAQIRGGDLLGFQLRRVIHHAAIALDERRFIHALAGLGVCEHTWSDPAWPRRLAALWRPVEWNLAGATPVVGREERAP